MIKNNFLKLAFVLGVLFFILSAKEAEAAYCRPPVTGDWVISSSCVMYEDVNGAAAGNIIVQSGGVLTLHSGKTVAWYPGFSILMQGGVIILNDGAEIRKTKLCMLDQDADGYADIEDQTYGDSCNTGGYRFRENIVSLDYVDTDIGVASAYKSSDSYLSWLGFTVNAAGDEVRIGGDNLRVCTGDTCTVSVPAGYGNVVIEGQLKVAGGSPGANKVLTSDANGLASWQAAGGSIPSGMIAFFASSCPAGWTEYAGLQGRMVLGNPSGGTVGTTVGTALGAGGTRTITQVPAHTHSIDPPNTSTNTTGSHSHNARRGDSGCCGPSYPGSNAISNWNYHSGGQIESAGSHSHSVDIGAFTSGSTGASSVDVTMPYIQLRGCQKD